MINVSNFNKLISHLEGLKPEQFDMTDSIGWARHDWGPSFVGHGEQQCKRCFITNREAAVLGLMNDCDAPSPSNRDVSTEGKPSSDAAPQGEASHVGIDSETPADPEGQPASPLVTDAQEK